MKVFVLAKPQMWVLSVTQNSPSSLAGKTKGDLVYLSHSNPYDYL